ncbi:DUF423 domain-containing protein [Thalassotalea agarivorans]|uniref:Uncharacterized membrane protein YgdD, TMEM256/DUF423 family n=1 Tax=Thalassotalea agarivorans TaxID=349064 RepID=A0A1I0FFI7_THASX|nr:DUF423 domain-containing protein [Thalassotalea agarivorans]SET56672.1 Uncharacterized membrane protein YgdD, TMEM256/DUF423 family [Thalassotalea agarivorans]
MKSTASVNLFIGLNGLFLVIFSALFSHGAFAVANPKGVVIALAFHAFHLCVMWLCHLSKGKLIKFAEMFFLSGIILFSFTIYIKSTMAIDFIGKLTPVGGVCFMIAWLLIAVSGIRKK